MTLQAKKPRPKRCRVETCRTLFVPARMGQAVCSPACAIIDAPKNQDKARKAIQQEDRKSLRSAKERVKPKGQYMREAQTAFNAWVRARDAGLPCVSCGTTADIQYAAGHFRSAGGHPELRFEPLNVHLQCNRNCNMAKSGNLGTYRVELIKRIGQNKVDWLEGPHEPKRYTIEDLKSIKAEYREKLKVLKMASQS